MMRANAKILDQELTCPICLAHPEKEVFQCQNGHPICSSCIDRLVNCPSCQLPFGLPRIRCRVMESLLDGVSLSCANKDAGCTRRFRRMELPGHHAICKFRPVNLCKWMGFECNFEASTVTPLINHLETCHAAKRWNRVQWPKFELSCNAPVVTLFRQLYLHQLANPEVQRSRKTWYLVLVTLTLEPNGNGRVFSCVPIHLHDAQSTAQHEVHLHLSVKDEQQAKGRLVCKWSGFPSNYKDVEEDIRYAPVRVTTNYVKKQALTSGLTEFNLFLSLSNQAT